MLNVHSDVVCPLLTHFTTMENLSSSASSSGKSYTSSAFLLLAANEPVARLAVAFPTACVPAKKSLFVSPPHLFNPTASIFTHQTPRHIPHIPHDPAPKFPPRSNSRLVVARRVSFSAIQNRTLTFAFVLDAATHRTKHTRITPSGASRCVFSSRQSLRRFTRASIRILVLVQRTVQ